MRKRRRVQRRSRERRLERKRRTLLEGLFGVPPSLHSPSSSPAPLLLLEHSCLTSGASKC